VWRPPNGPGLEVRVLSQTQNKNSMKSTTQKSPILVCDLKPAGPSGIPHLRPWYRQLAPIALAVAALLTVAKSPAAQLTWDAGDTNNAAIIDAASGTWNTDTTTNLNWNNGAGNVSWTQTSGTAALNGATFAGADAAAGTYQVALDGSQIAVNNLTLNANGYEFSGSPVYLINGTILSVADGKSVTFNNLVTGPNNAIDWRLGAGGAPASLALLGNFTAGQFRAGSTNGSILWLGGSGLSSGGVFTINANVTQTNGTWNNTATWQVGRPGASTQPDAGKAAFPGVYTMDGDSAVLNLTAQMQISRGGGTGKVIVKKGTVNLTAASANATVEVLKDNSALGQGFCFMEGGTMNVGSSSFAGVIGLAKFGAGTNSLAVFSQSGGIIKAWGGVSIGAASGTFNSVSLSAFTNSGGFLYVGNVGGVGITRYAFAPATNYFVLSGGTVGALQNWISTMPMTLDTLNGNITFQCADDAVTPFNIGLSGALTGPGGLYKTGGGTLTLSGANNYAGSTVVSNGILKIVPVLAPSNGSLTLDGSAGAASLSIAPASVGQFLTVNGNLTYAAGTVTADFDFGALPPSTSVAPIQVANNVACTVTPDFTIAGSAISVGTYPLIKYGGSVSGALPATPTGLPASTVGYITNIVATKTIALVVTTSPVSAALNWRVGSGDWGLIAAQNWSSFGSPVSYTEPNAVEFDDTASGPFPITVSTVTAVNPSAITILSTNDWTISGNGGSIDGGASLTKAGSGTATLSGANTFSGGTTISGGQLNINNGGNSAANSAIGTGPLTLALGAKVDNTSGQSVTMQPAIAQNWLDDWTFMGSTNLNIGAGAITLGNSVVVVTVTSNELEVGGAISDGGNAYKLVKAGSGTLTLGADSFFTGGMQLDSGRLQLKTGNGLGNGVFTISGSASIDNLSGADVTLSGISSVTLPTTGTITYLGTSNSLSFGIVAANQSGQGNKTLNVVNNTLTFGGDFTSGNSIIVKTGPGTLVLAGSGVSQFVGTVNEGELHLAHDFNPAIGTGDSGNGVLVQSNAVVKLASSFANQIPNSVETRLNAGGVFDLNGNSETIGLLRMTNGVLRNSAAGIAAALTTENGNGVILSSANNVFEVPDASAGLEIAGNVTGAGSLVKSGPGYVNLQGVNTYTGNTTVSNGILTINSPFLAATATVTVTSSGVLTLNFAGGETNTVAALVVGGVSKLAGVYNATTDSTYLAGAGNLRVVPPAPINPLPGTIQIGVSGNTLALSWPTNAGWILQTQTNALNVGLVAANNAWFNVPGSELATSTNITINPANGTVFFRMVHP
jgi:fibronectin-binding autotransporter adhesin